MPRREASCSSSRSRSPITTAARCASARTASCTSGSVTAAAQRPGQLRAESADAPGQAPADRRRPRRAVRDSPGQSLRGWRPRPSRRSSRSACAIRGGSASIARPATCTSATSARTIRGNRLVPAGSAAGANFGWRVDGGNPLHRQRRAGRVWDGSLDAAHRRVCARRRLLGDRGHRPSRQRSRARCALRVRRLLQRSHLERSPRCRRELGRSRRDGLRGIDQHVRRGRAGRVIFRGLRARRGAALRGGPHRRVDAIEYYHAGLDHYFISAEPSGRPPRSTPVPFSVWQRTGEAIAFFGAGEPGAALVHRFYIPPALGDSHFFTADAGEAADVRRRFPMFVEEGPLSMSTSNARPRDGDCPSGTRPVHRVWNARADSNHRYTTSAAIRDTMVARGGVAEGYGPDAVAMCAPL